MPLQPEQGANDYAPSPQQEHSQIGDESEQVVGDFKVNLVEEVKKYPCLWDVRARSFKETPKKKLAWLKVAQALSNSG